MTGRCCCYYYPVSAICSYQLFSVFSWRVVNFTFSVCSRAGRRVREAYMRLVESSMAASTASARVRSTAESLYLQFITAEYRYVQLIDQQLAEYQQTK